jgi:hypothetical protein
MSSDVVKDGGPVQETELLAALKVLLDRYVSLINCGDCGNWDPETEAEVIAARAAIKKATAHGE